MPKEWAGEAGSYRDETDKEFLGGLGAALFLFPFFQINLQMLCPRDPRILAPCFGTDTKSVILKVSFDLLGLTLSIRGMRSLD